MLRFNQLIVRSVLPAFAALVLAACSPAPPGERFEFTALRMGVQARIVLYAPDEPRARAAATAALERIADLEQVMSDYRDESELSLLCARAGGGPVPVSDDLFRILATSLEWSERTGGAFDITAGPLSRLWRESRATGVLPDEQTLAAARARSGRSLLSLDARTRTAMLAVPGMRLDLGGIGKGSAAQDASELLRRQGFPRHLVALAGDIVVGSPPPGERGWRIAIENGARPELRLADRAVSTSGNAAQFLEIGGVRYAHIIDPRTGLGLTSNFTATVVAREGATADALATSLCILGPAGAVGLSKHAAWVLISEGEREVWRSGRGP